MVDNSTTPQLSFEERLKALQAKYLQKLPDKIAEIETTWGELHHHQDADTWRTLHRLVHSITGTSATHGYHEVSTIARGIELLIQHIIEQESPLTPKKSTEIALLIEQLKAATENQDSIDDREAVHTSFQQSYDTWSNTDETEESTDWFPSEEDSLSEDRRRWLFESRKIQIESNHNAIFLVEDDKELAEDLAFQLGHFGYTIRMFDHPASLKQAMHSEVPAAIIMDVVFPEGGMAGIETIQDVQKFARNRIPVMFMSARDDISARLQAVRAGGQAYFIKPINVPALIDKLDELTTDKEPEPYRVLIIDDDPSIADVHQLVLEQDGMLVRSVNNPLDILHPLMDFRPDLILMDMYMPLCTGTELAAVIRQQETFVGIPIVFLSTETNLEKQLRAMHHGGDDFLTKPIEPSHLISIVKSRSERSRILRDTMIRDSLTGLFNHTTTKEYLHREVLVARRRNTNLSFAMIDLDKFKSVNDTYGHPTGDRVLKSLSRVLQQRLRRTDIIGRYGGEEFAIILPDTTSDKAVRVLDKIRDDFSQVRHRSDTVEFQVTFSCGVTSFPSYRDPSIISKVADEALYKAKRNGRNRVVLAQ